MSKLSLDVGEEFSGNDTDRCAIAKEMQDAGHVFEACDLDNPVDRWETGTWGFSISELTHRLTAPTVTLPDSGDRTSFDTGAVRDAMSGKGLPSLIPPEAIRRLARRFEDGATKYGAQNWMKGIPLSRYQDAISRHTLAAAEGQTDEDHLGAVLWNAAAWLWTEDEINAGRLPADLDDRPYSQKAVSE